MHMHDKGTQRQRVMEQDTFLRLTFNCAVSAAVPQTYICTSSDSAIFVLTLLESFLSAFTSPIVFGEWWMSFSSKEQFLILLWRSAVLWSILATQAGENMFSLKCGYYFYSPSSWVALTLFSIKEYVHAAVRLVLDKTLGTTPVSSYGAGQRTE